MSTKEEDVARKKRFSYVFDDAELANPSLALGVLKQFPFFDSAQLFSTPTASEGSNCGPRNQTKTRKGLRARC